MQEEALAKYKEILLKTLEFFDGFCTEHGLNYFASSGTAIGAVRHRGIIPWDDDIDVYMLRPDYERLLSLRDELPSRGYAVSALGDEDCVYPFIKFYDTGTTLIEDSYMPGNRIGVFLDIFALDEVSGSPEEVSRQKEEYLKLYKDFLLSFRHPGGGNLREWIEKKYYRTVAVSLLPTFIKKIIRNRFISYERKWSRESGDRLYFHGCFLDVNRELFPKEWFSGYHYLPFDSGRIRVNDRVHEYLTMLFGDYMTPPPPEKRIPEHKIHYLNLKEGISAKEARARIRKGETLVI